MTSIKKKAVKLRNRHFKLGKIILIGAGVIILGGMAGLAVILRDLPNPTMLSSGNYPESSLLYDRNGKLLYEMYSDKNRVPIKLSDVPDNMKKATLAIEDARFYSHGGFDFLGVVRGVYRTIFLRRLQGGSTLTQQLVKNGLLTPERTLSRKVKEGVLTVATELMYSKDQILEMYFNQTPYGGTLWGVQAAARGIFNKNAKDLDLAEAALLAGLPGSPTLYSPFTHPDLAKKRQELVLTRMEELKMITKEQHDKASAEKLVYNLSSGSIKAPHFVFYVKDQLVNTYGEEKVEQGGLKVTTSLDLDLQNYVQTVVASEVGKLKKMKVSNGAALITAPKTGEILAMVGSKDYFADDIDGKYNVTTALRQPGSSIKPLNYATGIETGKVTAASVYIDEPTCFGVENLKNYCPGNYGDAYHGVQTLRTSLGNSLNIPAVKTLKLVGVETFIASASAMGISTFKDPANYGLSLTLGGGEVHMTDMSVAFGVLANSGIRQDLHSILKVVDKKGNTVDEYVPTLGKRVLSRETAFIIQNILSDDGARSMVFGAGSLLKIKGHPEVAVKTGTTNDMRDNWTIGFTPDYVVLVWVGNNDNSKMGSIVSGTTGAAPIWNKLMNNLLKDKEAQKWIQPASIVGMNVCNLTGELVPDGGCDSHYEYFKPDMVPSEKLPVRRSILIDKDTGLPVQPGEQKTNVEPQDHLVVEDVTHSIMCLDCPPVNPSVTPAPLMVN
ncbi:transglycosylase domain-containing protein [Patescibacteria group bacterium]|nr:transglycosylase domain-containing protein [Patescibacteria group bacterium]